MNDRTPHVGENKEVSSFAWRGGQERQTTGIWMWSEPFLRYPRGSSEQVAVLLMDTQGMFDNETSMALTAQIFGLSTFVSSFQVSTSIVSLASVRVPLLSFYAVTLYFSVESSNSVSCLCFNRFPRSIMWRGEFKKTTCSI